MVALTVTIQDEGLREVLRGLTGRARDLRPAMDEIGAMLQAATDLRFERQIDPDGNAWAPLAPATIKRKAKMGREAILQLSGLLRGTITRAASSDSVTVSSNRPYSAIHQFGGVISRAAHMTAIFRRVVRRGASWDFERQNVTAPAGHTVSLPIFAGSRERFGKQGKGRAVMESHHAVGAYRITIPARPFLGISAADQAAGEAILRRFVMGAP